jgi:hypothetical protein
MPAKSQHVMIGPASRLAECADFAARVTPAKRAEKRLTTLEECGLFRIYRIEKPLKDIVNGTRKRLTSG